MNDSVKKTTGDADKSEGREQDNSKSTLLNVVNLADEAKPVVETAEAELTNYPEDEVSPGKRITLHFSLAPANDPEALIDSNFDKSPVSFDYGDGNILAGFEALMLGLKAGDKKSFVVNAEQAFGLKNEDNIQRYPSYQFPADLVMEKGLMINFSDAAGNEQAGVVSSFNADNVTIDFNHPLAGLDIIFTVDIKAIEII
jgi:FKBP-type peptidyl-prolyl cis-trans isomerase SlpA